MDYEVVATLGPASQEPEIWSSLLAAGATAFRLNTSHLSLEQLDAWLGRLSGFLAGREDFVPLVLDLQGGKWRLGRFSPCQLAAGESVQLVCAASAGEAHLLPVPHPDFFQAVSALPTGTLGEILLNDARVRLLVETAGPGWVRARVTQGGAISPAKGLTLPNSPYRIESLSARDQSILEKTRPFRFVRYAISYVRDADEMRRYRRLCGSSAYLAAKLERQPAISQAAQVMEPADELWLCRGDLGAELGLPQMAVAARRFSGQVSGLAVPCLLAGQVLEHLVEHPLPTRAEVCGLYDALVSGYAGVVLSDETAIGRHPVESCRTAALFKDLIRPLPLPPA